MNKINLSLFKSTNPAWNITVAGALQMIQCTSLLGLGYDSIAVSQGSNSQGPEDEISLAQLIAAKPAADEAFFIIGRYKDKDSRAYSLAEDKAEMYTPQDDGTPDKPKDGLNSFIALYAVRHPGAPIAEAEAAATSIPSVLAAAKAELGNIRALVTL